MGKNVEFIILVQQLMLGYVHKLKRKIVKSVGFVIICN
jgi:hypothetical protein